MLASLACAHGQFAARRALCSYREGIRVPWGLRLGPFYEVVAGLRRALSPTPYSCPFLVAHQTAQPVHVDRQHGQAHHQREVLRTLLPHQCTAPKSEIGQTRLYGWVLPPRCLERRRALPRTLRQRKLALLRKRIERQPSIQCFSILQAVKAPVKTARIELWKSRLHRVNDRYRYLYI